jgi:peptidoglycan/LPS O-acetylase OafA/YrhL
VRSGFAGSRVPGIDVLRGLCIVAVVFLHINLRIDLQRSPLGLWLPTMTKLLVGNGYYGVKVFFVISGFLIAGWSLKRWGSLSEASLRQFYWMRFTRIVPPLAALLLVLCILHRARVPHFTIEHSSLSRAVLAASTFHVNWLEARVGYLPGTWDALWSLSIEEAFYICFPLLCLLVQREGLLVLSLSVFVALGPFARTVFSDNELWRDKGYLSCMDGIALGCIAAIVVERAAFGQRTRLWLRISGCALCIGVVAWKSAVRGLGLYRISLDDTILSFGTALLLMGLATETRTDSPFDRLLAPLRFGRNSYEIYLTHMFVVFPMVWVFDLWHMHSSVAPLWFLLTTVLAGAMGAAVARFYSEPLNRRLRTLLPQQARPAAAASPTKATAARIDISA